MAQQGNRCRARRGQRLWPPRIALVFPQLCILVKSEMESGRACRVRSRPRNIAQAGQGPPTPDRGSLDNTHAGASGDSRRQTMARMLNASRRAEAGLTARLYKWRKCTVKRSFAGLKIAITIDFLAAQFQTIQLRQKSKRNSKKPDAARRKTTWCWKTQGQCQQTHAEQGEVAGGYATPCPGCGCRRAAARCAACGDAG